MLQFEDEAVMRVYGGFSRALLSVADVGALAPSRGNDARIAASVAVYRNNVRSAYLRVLQDAFPVVLRLVGDGFFRYMAHEYFHAHPPKSPLVARYGDRLPQFLEKFDPAGGLPYLPDIARFEIAWLEAYHAAEAAPLRPDELLGLIGDNSDRARLVLHPSARLLSSPHPIHAIWRHNREKREEPLRLQPRGEQILILRPEGEVKVEAINLTTFQAIKAIAEGTCLGPAIEAAIEKHPGASITGIVQLIATSGVVTAASIVD